jgi:hypothetical protein
MLPAKRKSAQPPILQVNPQPDFVLCHRTAECTGASRLGSCPSVSRHCRHAD